MFIPPSADHQGAQTEMQGLYHNVIDIYISAMLDSFS